MINTLITFPTSRDVSVCPALGREREAENSKSFCPHSSQRRNTWVSLVMGWWEHFLHFHSMSDPARSVGEGTCEKIASNATEIHQHHFWEQPVPSPDLRCLQHPLPILECSQLRQHIPAFLARPGLKHSPEITPCGRGDNPESQGVPLLALAADVSIKHVLLLSAACFGILHLWISECHPKCRNDGYETLQGETGSINSSSKCFGKEKKNSRKKRVTFVAWLSLWHQEIAWSCCWRSVMFRDMVKWLFSHKSIGILGVIFIAPYKALLHLILDSYFFILYHKKI